MDATAARVARAEVISTARLIPRRPGQRGMEGLYRGREKGFKSLLTKKAAHVYYL